MKKSILLLLLMTCCADHSYAPWIPPALTQEQIAAQEKWDDQQKKDQQDTRDFLDFQRARTLCILHDDKYQGCNVIEAHQKKIDEDARKKWDADNQQIIRDEEKKVQYEAAKLSAP